MTETKLLKVSFCLCHFVTYFVTFGDKISSLFCLLLAADLRRVKTSSSALRALSSAFH